MFLPGFEAKSGCLEMREELLVHEPLPSLRNYWFDALPNPKELATRLKKQVLVQ